MLSINYSYFGSIPFLKECWIAKNLLLEPSILRVKYENQSIRSYISPTVILHHHLTEVCTSSWKNLIDVDHFLFDSERRDLLWAMMIADTFLSRYYLSINFICCFLCGISISRSFEPYAWNRKLFCWKRIKVIKDIILECFFFIERWDLAIIFTP